MDDPRICVIGIECSELTRFPAPPVTTDISAQKSGHRLRIYAREGYYAPCSPSGEEQ